MIKPITPDEVDAKAIERLPQAVIEAFNEIIAETWDGECAKFYRSTVLEIIAKRLCATKNHTLGKGWLSIAELYRQVGWDVECGAAMFTFKKKA